MIDQKTYHSRILKLGRLSLGGNEPIRLQSMTNTPTMDVEATCRQVIDLYEAGCEIVRITARNKREAGKLGEIRAKLENRDYDIPLVADVHFNPKVAEEAASIVHKVRINPGNYFDRQYFLTKEKIKPPNNEQAENFKEGIIRLTNICQKHGTIIRVGVNHGSLSERILMKYGNTAEGMVASAMEFLDVCKESNFHDLVVSMKSSHVFTMVNATLGIVRAMMKKRMNYPIHLGITEAGEGIDGRIRSAAGIGPLLAMGIGDTIRVSLTEDPVREIPVAAKLRDLYSEIRKLEKPPSPWPAEGKAKVPELLSLIYPDHDFEDMAIIAASEISSMILRAKGNDYRITGNSGKEYPKLVLDILQATGVRISGTEYISCPTCGRTSFDIQAMTKEIKKHTRGLKNVKIAVMGCIVNGPGEMADAHYGYVGSGKGKVTLYHNGKAVIRNIMEKDALQELLKLISETQPEKLE